MPDLPLIFAVETSEDWPAIDLPPTSMIRSSFLIPAFFAGESSNTWTTRSPRLSWATLTPIPSNSGSVTLCSKTFVSSGVK